MKVAIAYIEEPPFGWTESNRATGADVELAEAVLRAIGVDHIEHHATTFAELLPGVEAGRWDMNVPLFVTPERASKVAFSLPVWAIGDGFLVRAGNPKALNSYASLAECHGARLGIIAGQVQHESARASGVSEDQIVIFEQQSDAIEALRLGAIDAYASTAVGNRVLAGRIGASVEAVEHDTGKDGKQLLPTGAFSFNKSSRELLGAVNEQLRLYRGTPDHRTRMSRFGITGREIDPTLVVPELLPSRRGAILKL